jgi:hypothetical protein
MRSQVEAMLNGKRSKAPVKLKKEDKMELWPKARRKENTMMPAEIGTERTR